MYFEVGLGLFFGKCEWVVGFFLDIYFVLSDIFKLFIGVDKLFWGWGSYLSVWKIWFWWICYFMGDLIRYLEGEILGNVVFGFVGCVFDLLGCLGGKKWK